MRCGENRIITSNKHISIKNAIRNKRIVMKKCFKWLLESNRPKHILVGFIISVTLGVGAAFAAAASAEMKDWMWNGKRGGTFGWLKGNGFDWLDFTATMIGGVIGTALHCLF